MWFCRIKAGFKNSTAFRTRLQKLDVGFFGTVTASDRCDRLGVQVTRGRSYFNSKILPRLARRYLATMVMRETDPIGEKKRQSMVPGKTLAIHCCFCWICAFQAALKLCGLRQPLNYLNSGLPIFKSPFDECGISAYKFKPCRFRACSVSGIFRADRFHPSNLCGVTVLTFTGPWLKSSAVAAGFCVPCAGAVAPCCRLDLLCTNILMIYNELKPKHKSSPIEVCCWVYHIYSICSLSSKNNVGHLHPKKIASKKY